MGEIGGSFSKTVKPIVSLPMVICCGRLVVVSSIPPGDFFFVFLAHLLFWGAIAVQLGSLGPPEKAIVGGHAHRSWKCPTVSKIALLALETTRFAIAVWALGGAFLGVRADSSRRT